MAGAQRRLVHLLRLRLPNYLFALLSSHRETNTDLTAYLETTYTTRDTTKEKVEGGGRATDGGVT